MTELRDRIYAVLEDMTDSDLVELHNKYCEINHYYDDMIERMDLLDEICYGMTATEIMDKFEGIDTNENYFVYGIYEVSSFDYYADAPITYYDEIADKWKQKDNLGNWDFSKA